MSDTRTEGKPTNRPAVAAFVAIGAVLVEFGAIAAADASGYVMSHETQWKVALLCIATGFAIFAIVGYGGQLWAWFKETFGARAQVEALRAEIAALRSKAATVASASTELLSDAAAIERTRAVFQGVKHRFDMIAVTGKTMIGLWRDEILKCAERGVHFRFVFFISNDEAGKQYMEPYSQAIAVSLSKLTGDLSDMIGILTALKKELKPDKVHNIEWRFILRCPLYSMWIVDDGDSAACNLRMYRYSGQGEGLTVRTTDPELHKGLSREFARIWDSGLPPPSV